MLCNRIKLITWFSCAANRKHCNHSDQKKPVQKELKKFYILLLLGYDYLAVFVSIMVESKERWFY